MGRILPEQTLIHGNVRGLLGNGDMACERVRGPQAYDGNHTKTLSQMKAKCSSDVSAGCEWECINNAVDVNTTSELPAPGTLHPAPSTLPSNLPENGNEILSDVCRLPFAIWQFAVGT